MLTLAQITGIYMMFYFDIGYHLPRRIIPTSPPRLQSPTPPPRNRQLGPARQTRRMGRQHQRNGKQVPNPPFCAAKYTHLLRRRIVRFLRLRNLVSQPCRVPH